MKVIKKYRVRVDVPIMVDVALELDDDEPMAWRAEYRAAGIAAIKRIVEEGDTADFIVDNYHPALRILKDDGMAYAHDFTEVDCEMETDDVIDFQVTARECRKCCAGMIGDKCNYCGEEQ